MRNRTNPSFRLASLVCLPILFTATASADPSSAEESRTGASARYIVFEIDEDGDVRPQMHRFVRMSSPRRSLTPEEVAAQLARPARDEEAVHVRMFTGDGGLAFEDVVNVPRWTRVELPGEDGAADSRLAVPQRRAFAVRLPVIESSWLALSVGRDGDAPREKTFRDAEFDLDALAADTSLRLARFVPEGEARSSSAANSGNRVDLLIMGDGYTSGERAKFDSDAANVISSFFGLVPYSTYRNFFNTATLFTASPQSGADHPPYAATCVIAHPPTCCSDPLAQTDPKAGTFVNTAFDATYCNANTHRALVLDAGKVLAAAAGTPDWDEIICIVNDSTYGATGGQVAVISTHPSAVNSAQHEIGHTLVRLADEYDSAYPGYPACSDVTSPPCEPNVTDETDRADIKWRDFIAASTPLPTPVTGTSPSTIGLFEGARYQTMHMFRPKQTCLMRALGQAFCEICKQEFVFQLYRGGWGSPASGIDLIEPGSEHPAPGFVSIPFPGTQTFTVGTLKPTGGSLSTSWYVDGAQQSGATGNSFTYTPAAQGSHRVEVKVRDTTGFVHADTGTGASLTSRAWTAGVGQTSRFQIQVEWAVPAQGRSGVGTEVALTSDTRYFWFFTPSNIELVIKVLDGRSINNHYWVFYGALSSVQYTITVTDTQTGAIKVYSNPSGTLASVADTEAFAGVTGGGPELALAGPADVQWALAAQAKAGFAPGFPAVATLAGAPVPAACAANTQTLCLNASRFQVQVDWSVPAQGRSGTGTAIPITSDTGYFWFFSSANVELVIKVLDGRAINQHYWVFYGALSSVQYTIRVTDAVTGTTKTYTNPSGTLASVADTSAF